MLKIFRRGWLIAWVKEIESIWTKTCFVFQLTIVLLGQKLVLILGNWRCRNQSYTNGNTTRQKLPIAQYTPCSVQWITSPPLEKPHNDILFSSRASSEINKSSRDVCSWKDVHTFPLNFYAHVKKINEICVDWFLLGVLWGKHKGELTTFTITLERQSKLNLYQAVLNKHIFLNNEVLGYKGSCFKNDCAEPIIWQFTT